MKPIDRGSKSSSSGGDRRTGETSTGEQDASKSFDVTAAVRRENRGSAEPRGQRQIREREELTKEHARRSKKSDERQMKEIRSLQVRYNMAGFLKDIEIIESLHDQGRITDNKYAKFNETIHKKHQMTFSDEYMRDNTKLQEKHMIESMFTERQYELKSECMADLHNLEILYDNKNQEQYILQSTKLQDIYAKQENEQNLLIRAQKMQLESTQAHNLPTPERQFREQFTEMKARHDQQRDKFWQQAAKLPIFRAKL